LPYELQNCIVVQEAASSNIVFEHGLLLIKFHLGFKLPVTTNSSLKSIGCFSKTFPVPKNVWKFNNSSVMEYEVQLDVTILCYFTLTSLTLYIFLARVAHPQE
jgi:hypothetical protein